MTGADSKYADWIGAAERVEDAMAPAAAMGLRAVLDGSEPPFAPGDPLPPLWQWVYFLPHAPQSRLGPDGHPERGGFLPPVALPRRMFAGCRLSVHRPLRVGVPAVRDGTVLDVRETTGGSGPLVFVTVRYVYGQDGAACLEEEQDIVYRAPGGPVPAPAPLPAWPALPANAWARTVVPDSRLLFRFSAVTFNAHRIHYDRPYAQEAEGYPGLVVHGPLTAILLMDLLRRHTDRPVTRFAFRGKAPLFDLSPFRLVGRPAPQGPVALEAQRIDGQTAMTAEAELTDG